MLLNVDEYDIFFEIYGLQNCAWRELKGWWAIALLFQIIIIFFLS